MIRSVPIAARGRAMLRLAAASGLVSFFFPRSCAACGRVLAPRAALVVCPSCRGRLIPVRGETCLLCRREGRGDRGFAAGRRCSDPAHDGFRVYAPVQMVDPADRIVHAIKFHDRPEVGETLAVLMARSLRREGAADWDLVVPMPLHAARERSRGYNQSREIADRLARSLGARVAGQVLVRRRATTPQADLDYAARSANVAGAFAIRATRRGDGPGTPFTGRRCLLVDDVATTGHTLCEALAAVRQGGASATAAAVFALA